MIKKHLYFTVALIIGFAFDVHVGAQELFYRDKTIRIIVGFSAGGGFDTYSRVIARHLGKHIPGNPAIIVENRAGAASLIAANHLYKVAKPDGLTIGNFHGNQILNQALGYPGIEFDARKFEWIGVPVRENKVCAFTRASGITSFEKLRTAKPPVKIGGQAPGDDTYNTPVIFKEALDLPMQIVAGYKGTAEIRLAAEGGEVAGGCWGWESMKPTWRKGLESGEVVVVLQGSPTAHPDLPNVPLAIDLAKTDEARQLLTAGIHDPAAMTRPYALPPGTPKQRVQILRKAFIETLKNPEFVEDAKKSNLDIDPVSNEELERMVNGLLSLNPKIVAKLKEVLK